MSAVDPCASNRKMLRVPVMPKGLCAMFRSVRCLQLPKASSATRAPRKSMRFMEMSSSVSGSSRVRGSRSKATGVMSSGLSEAAAQLAMPKDRSILASAMRSPKCEQTSAVKQLQLTSSLSMVRLAKISPTHCFAREAPPHPRPTSANSSVCKAGCSRTAWQKGKWLWTPMGMPLRSKWRKPCGPRASVSNCATERMTPALPVRTQPQRLSFLRTAPPGLSSRTSVSFNSAWSVSMALPSRFTSLTPDALTTATKDSRSASLRARPRASTQAEWPVANAVACGTMPAIWQACR
mmetsp:Transcript_82755/g.229728  ORF Transcript_82755/g.229728 Transcript_82755/m.229728 type:complete len:293 (+) Transcript_82755:1762-2640(+)